MWQSVTALCHRPEPQVCRQWHFAGSKQQAAFLKTGAAARPFLAAEVAELLWDCAYLPSGGVVQWQGTHLDWQQLQVQCMAEKPLLGLHQHWWSCAAEVSMSSAGDLEVIALAAIIGVPPARMVQQGLDFEAPAEPQMSFPLFSISGQNLPGTALTSDFGLLHEVSKGDVPRSCLLL